MNRKSIVIILSFLFLCIGIYFSYAQESISASGGNASGIGGNASYSYGQILYTTEEGSNGTVANGVQHAYEISVLTAYETVEGISLNCYAYPNPTSDVLWLKIESETFQNFNFGLYGNTGLILLNASITQTETSIDMNTFTSGIYFLKVYKQNNILKVFKIIKK
jgi:hypothetical protein